MTTSNFKIFFIGLEPRYLMEPHFSVFVRKEAIAVQLRGGLHVGVSHHLGALQSDGVGVPRPVELGRERSP